MGEEDTKSIEYEETPIIEPIEEKDLPNPLDTPEIATQSRHGKHPSSIIGKVLLFFLLFCLGIAGSIFARPYVEGMTLPKLPSLLKQKTETTIQPTPSTKPVDETAGWKPYTLKTGTRDITYLLPETVVPVVCDGPACPSQGTFLPGGTRFTVSSKTTSPISNFSKLIVKDAGGKVFVTKETTVAGMVAVDYSGSFTGVTTGGYTFIAMHGVMIQVTPTITVEMNHFAPNGITSEFEKDDVVFSQILKTITFVSTSSATVK
jgi:hypothetical protein